MTEEFNADERVQDMIKAIRYKSNFISDQLQNQAKEVYDVEFNKILETEKSKVSEKLQTDRAKYLSDKKIEKSRLYNELRLSKMSRRFSLLENLKNDIRTQLQQKLKDKEEYKRLMKSLILQSMIKLMEPAVELQCLKDDVPLVEGLIKECESDFNQLMKQECKKNVDTKIKINKDHFLDDKQKNLLGGIVLSCYDGRIVCSNTIDSRINFAFQEMLPEIREGLYPDPVRAAHDQKRRQEQLAAQEHSVNKHH